MNVHRSMVHCQLFEMPQYRDIVVNNTDLRVEYLMDNMSEEAWKTLLQKREKAQHKNRDISNLLRMFVDTTGDYLRQLIVKEVDTEECMDVLDKLVRYFNVNMELIHKRYNCVTPWILAGPRYDVVHKTYKATDGF